MKLTQSIVSLIIACTTLALFSGCVTVRPSGSVLTSQSNYLRGKRVPVDVFSSEDVIRYYVSVTWDDVTKEAGNQKVTWNWYKDGQLVSTNEKYFYVKKAPFEIFTTRPASALGLGHFKVETLVGNKLMASTEFEIK
jgi:hypothetical protein